jgi:hypothetical protein
LTISRLNPNANHGCQRESHSVVSQTRITRSGVYYKYIIILKIQCQE